LHLMSKEGRIQLEEVGNDFRCGWCLSRKRKTLSFRHAVVWIYNLTLSVIDWDVVHGPTVYLDRELELTNFWWSSQANSRLTEVCFRLSLIFNY
jgi:hypothetical protein